MCQHSSNGGKPYGTKTGPGQKFALRNVAERRLKLSDPHTSVLAGNGKLNFEARGEALRVEQKIDPLDVGS